MEIVSAFVREQQRYLKSDLKKKFFPKEDGVEKFIKDLKSYGVLKTIKYNKAQMDMSDLLEEDNVIADEFAEDDEYFYVFTYVGIITIGRRIVKVYPKYLSDETKSLEHMKEVLKVLEKYSNSEEQIINIFNGSGDKKSFNILAIILFLMNDYYENGIYNNSEDIVEINGEGPILWGKTIDENFALIQDNRPFYMEFYTSKTEDNEMDYFKRLHEVIITECSKQLKESHLLNLFDMEEVILSEEELIDFGEREYILERIYSELNIQYSTRKQILLKTMYAYISQDRKLLDEEQGLSMYGTTAYNMVWESVCANVFNNKLDTAIGDLGLSRKIAAGYKPETKLINLIDKPRWLSDDIDKEALETLRPDLIAIETSGDVDYFAILDAKYYNIHLEKDEPLRGTPGVGDVTKQYLYQLAYKKFLEDHCVTHISNCFLMPTEEEEMIVKGKAQMGILSALNLQDIQIRLLPVSKMYRHYLRNTHMSLDELKL